MSEPGPSGNPFEQLPIFGDLARLFSQQGPVSWDVARQISLLLATEGQPEVNVDPLVRMRFEELARVAELNVANATGLPTAPGGGVLQVRPVGRGEWAQRGLEAYRPQLERLATALSLPGSGDEVEPDSGTELLGSIGRLLGPVLLGMQSGLMVGHLAQRALGQYDVPLPRPVSDELLVVPANLDAFGSEWSLPEEDLRLWILLHEVVHHAVLGVPHVRARLGQLLDEYVSSFEVDPSSLEGSIGELDLGDPSGLQSLLGNPETLFGAIQTSTQRDVLVRIEALVLPLVGYVDYVLDTVGRRLITSYDMVTEALRRRRVEATEGDRFVGRLLGIELDQTRYDRGAAFVRGVVDRAGPDAANQLWASERRLPTPAEFDAPGLYLARLEFDEGDAGPS
ncbi:MAG: zinc-dependent metalloprotease [Acidimicrobiia bacterium]|nr:zinc-dependent metalloprotease [Acidimicrobiia bacterium]